MQFYDNLINFILACDGQTFVLMAQIHLSMVAEGLIHHLKAV